MDVHGHSPAARAAPDPPFGSSDGPRRGVAPIFRTGWAEGRAATMAVVIGRTRGCGSDRRPASLLSRASWPRPAPTACAGAQPRGERTVSGRAPTDGRVRVTPALGPGPVCENTPRPKAGLAPVATTQRGDEFGQEATGRPDYDGTGNLGVCRRALHRSLESAGGAQCCRKTPEAIGTQTEEKSCGSSCNQPDASRSGCIHVTAGRNGKAGQADIPRPSATDDARRQRASCGRRPVSH
ncbi:hypothetical protein D8I24_4023 (plasmid) [Cupriavidus necator H850]|nr:hypothetical protein D8I24_4023 [Cupriavidus necator H850]